MSYFLLDGVDSLDYKLYPLRLPLIERAAKRLESLSVPGRSGLLHLWNGEYEEIVKEVACWYYGTDAEALNALISDATEFVFSTDPEYIYTGFVNGFKYVLSSPSVYEVTILINCYPLKKLRSESSITITSGMSVTSPATAMSFPSFAVVGVGTVSVGGREFEIDASAETLYILGGEVMNVTDAAGNNENDQMTGEFPYIDAGETVVITKDAGITSLVMTPNWRFS